VQERGLWVAVGVGVVLSLGVAYGLTSHGLVVGSHWDRWYYRYAEHTDPRGLTFGGLAALFCGALAIWVERRRAGRDWIPIAVCLLAATAAQLALHSLAPFTFERIFASDSANSYFSVSTRFDARTLLARFLELRPTFDSHAHSNMPGKVLFLRGLELFSRDPGTLALLVVIASNLGGVLLYGFVRDLFGDRRVALYAFVLYLLVPARLFFFPLLNTITPVLVFACLWSWLRTLQTGGAIDAVLLGFAVSALGLFEPVPFVTGLLGAALAARSIAIGEIDTRRAAILALIAGGVPVACYVALYLATGFDWVAAFRVLFLDAMNFHGGSERPYGTWLIANLWEFSFGVGGCQAVLVFAALWHALRARSGRREALIQSITVFSLGWLASLAALDLSGVSRGEVIRIWIFLACLVQVPSAYVCARLTPPIALALVVATTMLTSAIALAQVVFLAP
jgi:hypothetical protein